MPEIDPAVIVYEFSGANAAVRVGTFTHHDGSLHLDLRCWPDPSQAGQLGMGKVMRVPFACLDPLITALEALRPYQNGEDSQP